MGAKGTCSCYSPAPACGSVNSSAFAWRTSTATLAGSECAVRSTGRRQTHRGQPREAPPGAARYPCHGDWYLSSPTGCRAAPRERPPSPRPTVPCSDWKRSTGWREAIVAINRPRMRVHDLRLTYASLGRRGRPPSVAEDDGTRLDHRDGAHLRRSLRRRPRRSRVCIGRARRPPV